MRSGREIVQPAHGRAWIVTAPDAIVDDRSGGILKIQIAVPPRPEPSLVQRGERIREEVAGPAVWFGIQPCPAISRLPARLEVEGGLATGAGDEPAVLEGNQRLAGAPMFSATLVVKAMTS